MSYFLSDKPLSIGQESEISGAEAQHLLHARRVKVGEHILIQGTDGKRFLAEVTNTDRHTVTIQTLEARTVPPEPTIPITLFQALVAEQALDTILQKATELGAAHIILFSSANSPVNTLKNPEHKLERWQNILVSATKQSDRAAIPTLEAVPAFADAITKAKNCQQLFLLDPYTGVSIQGHNDPTPNSIGLWIGPEGGFSNDEITAIKTLPKTITISLGPRILRADTAAIAGLSIIQNHFGDI